MTRLADEYGGRALEILEELSASDPRDARLARDRVLATFMLAFTHQEWGKDEEVSGNDGIEHYDLARYHYELAQERLAAMRRNGQPLSHLSPMPGDIAGKLKEIEEVVGSR